MRPLLLAAVALASLAASDASLATPALRTLEGFSAQPYADRGGYSVGFGHWSRTRPAGVTRAQAEAVLAADVAAAEAAARRLVPTYDRHPAAVRSVLVQLAFQLGEAGLGRFHRMLAAVAAGDYDGAAGALLDSRLARQCAARTHLLADALRAAD